MNVLKRVRFITRTKFSIPFSITCPPYPLPALDLKKQSFASKSTKPTSSHENRATAEKLSNTHHSNEKELEENVSLDNHISNISIKNLFKRLGINITYQIYKGQWTKIFEKNSEEDFEKKIKYLSSELGLLVDKGEVVRMICFIPDIFDESFEELKQKIEYFKKSLECSKKELKKFFLSRKVIVLQSIEILKLQYAILSEEYHLPNETIRELFFDSYSPIHLPAMVGIVAERKMVLKQLYPSPDYLNHAITVVLQLLWMPSQQLYDVIDALIEEGLATSIDDPNLHRAFNCSPLLVRLPKCVVRSRVCNSFSLLTQSESTQQKSEVNTKAEINKRFPNIAADQAAVWVKYQETLDSIERKLRIVLNSEPGTEGRKRQSEENMQKERQFAACFFMKDGSPDKEQLLSLIYEEFEDTFRKKRKELSREGEGKDVKLAMMRGMKVIEGLHASKEQAIKIILNSNMIASNFPLIVKKLFFLTVYLQLEPAELISILCRYPKLLAYKTGNLFPKLEVISKAALEYCNSRQEISTESRTFEEGIEYSRHNPVIEVVRETIVQDPRVLGCALGLFKEGINEWKKQPAETRKWKQLPTMIRKNKVKEDKNQNENEPK